MKLIYRGISYQHNHIDTNSKEQEIYDFSGRRLLHYLTYRGINYTKFHRLNIFARGGRKL